MRLEDRFAAIEALKAEIDTCTTCPLYQSRLRAVSGTGSISARIMFIEDFPILSYQQWSKTTAAYFERLLGTIGLKRQDVFVTSVIKCVLVHQHRPKPIEITACQQHLEQEIDLIDPLMIVTIGRISARLFFQQVKFRQLHGQPEFEEGRVYYPAFHPVVALRNRHLEHTLEADFKRIPELLKLARDGGQEVVKPLVQGRLF